MKIDLGALHRVKEHWRGIGVTVLVNWAVKPFSMALLGWLFVGWLFRPWLPDEQIASYIAGHPRRRALHGDGVRLVQPLRRRAALHAEPGGPQRRHHGRRLRADRRAAARLSAIVVPWETLVISVVMFIVIPVLVAQAWRARLLQHGPDELRRARSGRSRYRWGHCWRRWSCCSVSRANKPAAAGHRVAGRANLDSGLLQCRPGVPAQPATRRGALRRAALRR